MSDNKKNNLNNGSSYSIKEIFCGMDSQSDEYKYRKIIIPDLQRDYCWGSATTVLEPFISSLISLLNEDSQKEYSMGIIYAYESPENHIQLCDGQQRLTTLYLLCGILYKKSKNEVLKNILISNFELNKDDKEPRLLYAIRESTLYFLSDLICNYFLAECDLTVSDIEKQSWYYKDYNNDPSITSILSALETIEKTMKSLTTEKIENLIELITVKIKLFYFDMQDRYRGEEMFVVINTTGEPLTITENLKPIVLGGLSENDVKEYSKQWEDRETWFWQNRKKNEHEADDGFRDFLKWIIKAEKIKEDVDIIKDLKDKPEENLRKIENYFQKIKKILEFIQNYKSFSFEFSYIKHLIESEVYNLSYFRELDKDQINNILVPLLFFMANISDEVDVVYQFLRRLRKNYFDLIRSYRKNNYVDWRYILNIIHFNTAPIDVFKSMKTEDIKDIKNNTDIWYSTEEIKKTGLFPERFTWKHNEDHELWNWEDHLDFQGDISPLIIMNSVTKDFSSYTDLTNVIPQCQISIELIRKNFGSYNKLYQVFHNSSENQDYKYWYKLFRTFSGINSISHRKLTNGISGLDFNKYEENKHITKSVFYQLCLEKDKAYFIKQYIKNIWQIKEEEIKLQKILSNQDMVNIWLLVKYFETKNSTIFSENDISIYDNIESNKIDRDKIFSFDNFSCGEHIKSSFGKCSKIKFYDLTAKQNRLDLLKEF